MKDYDNRITTDDIQLAESIISKAIGSVERPPIPIDSGSVNKVFQISASAQKFILRMSQATGKLLEYEKEKWCARQARSQGVPTPEVLQIGRDGDTSFMIQNFVIGHLGTEISIDRTAVWASLGGHLAKIHSTPTSGFGLTLTDASKGKFDQSWERYVDYNISSLGTEDELSLRGYLSPEESKLLKETFEILRKSEVTFGLCHGDVALRNTIITPLSVVYILDWGCALSDLVPYSDFANILRWERPTPAEFKEFLTNYGISTAEFDRMRPTLWAVALLSATDKLRWAIDHSHESLDRYVSGLRWALMMVSEKGDCFTKPYSEDFGLGQITNGSS
jgi:aminoglycoside phosphotransferase (APT) family kinase protein